MGKLEGKIALVTGGTSGIGLATAKRFVNEGAYVFITGRREAELSVAAKEIGKNVTGVQGDVSNLADLDRLFAQIKREKGRLDVVFANAGVAKYATFGTITEDSSTTPPSTSTSRASSLRCRRRCRCCPMERPSSSMRRSLPVKVWRRTAFTALPKPPCVRSRGRGRRT